MKDFNIGLTFWTGKVREKMVPKPEEAFGEVYQAEKSQERSIYSNSDGEGCAILVKAGQLDSFT